jgi:cytidine deaminase
MNKDLQKISEAAVKARERAHAPFSGFKVGAALLTKDNEIITGCNIENASYGLTMCAERVAIFKALSEGKNEFQKIVVAADTEVLTPPCGACRQIIWEFCGDVEIVLTNLQGKVESMRMKELFPRAFDSKFLD